jgi:hypothetical protein
MKDNIQNLGDEVAIVIYDAPLPPKYFRLTKRFIKTLFIFVPLFLVTILFLFFSWGLGSRLSQTPTPTLPKVISESDSKLLELESEIADLQASNKALSEKLAAGPGVASANDPYLGIVKKPYGMQNFLAQNRVTLDQFELLQDNNKVNLKFQIISASPENKVTGHIIVTMISEAGILIYPKEANSMLSQGIKYSMGEPFSVSRLRPTNAEFLHRLTGESVKFVIYIFTREGDLLLIRETESFKIGAKS